jgi:hypothetical protein
MRALPAPIDEARNYAPVRFRYGQNLHLEIVQAIRHRPESGQII